MTALMLASGLIVAGIGAFTGLGAIIMELRTGEEKYMALMKISTILFGAGGIMAGLS